MAMRTEGKTPSVPTSSSANKDRASTACRDTRDGFVDWRGGRESSNRRRRGVGMQGAVSPTCDSRMSA
eukprot:523600-Hanusia_phi.AAC.1